MAVNSQFANPFSESAQADQTGRELIKEQVDMQS